MKKIWIFLILLLPVIAAAPLVAQETPEGARQEAFENIKVALKLADQAQKMVTSPATRESVKTAVDLYVQAGQLFEKAEVVFKTLGVQYVSKDDLDNCTKAKEDCIKAIQKLKESLTGSSGPS